MKSTPNKLKISHEFISQTERSSPLKKASTTSTNSPERT